MRAIPSFSDQHFLSCHFLAAFRHDDTPPSVRAPGPPTDRPKMPVTLLPASAAAFAPRGQPNIVLNSKVEPWLTATLKRINRIKRPLNSVPQHTRCLTETLSAPTAIWTLCSLMLPKAPEADLRRDDNPLVEALCNYQLMHVEAYVVHVDMVSQNEVAFKLSQDTIDALIEFHHDVFSPDAAASTPWEWADKEAQLKKLHEDFVQATNRFVHRAAATALEGLEEDGGGELLSGGADEVKAQILSLFLPLLPPPPPRVPDLVRPAPILPSSTGAEWWPSTIASAHAQPHQQPQSHQEPPQHPPPQHEQWKVLPSSPSPTSSPESVASSHVWPSMSLADLTASTPSPAPAPATPVYTTAYSTAGYSAPEFYSAPMTCAPLIPQLPLPSVLAQQCSTSAGFGGFGVGFAWDRYNEYALPYATI